jgi:hypothetical protein
MTMAGWIVALVLYLIGILWIKLYSNAQGIRVFAPLKEGGNRTLGIFCGCILCIGWPIAAIILSMVMRNSHAKEDS